MREMIRCPACRGAKRMPKLGGMIGECNTCEGTGNIALPDKPVKVEVTIEDVLSKELINAVADCVPASTVGLVLDESHVTPMIEVKIDPKKALYKRKRA